MIIAVQGSKDFDDYNIFLRAIGVAMSGMTKDDTEVNIYSVGPSRVNSMVLEFCNLSERSMKARGMKIRNYKVPVDWMIENLERVNYFAFLSRPKQPPSKLTAEAELKGVEVGIFRY